VESASDKPDNSFICHLYCDSLDLTQSAGFRLGGEAFLGGIGYFDF